MDLIGQRFGNIRVTSVVGQGGMGEVYSGYDEKLERKVAIKVVNAHQRLDAEARERLLREARALSRLDHPNICRIHDYIESHAVDVLVLEYIDGRTLGDMIREPMSRLEKLRIAADIAAVLVAAHRAGIIHRDLKPENVMLTTRREVKVLDFGLARWLQKSRTMSGATWRRIEAEAEPLGRTGRDREVGDPETTLHLPAEMRVDSSATEAGIAVGTPLYMSPEQARGELLTPASDLFSFGLLLQVLFTGREPHPEHLTGRELMVRVARGETNPVEGAPGDIAALIQRLKQLAPADRPTAVEVVERLRHLSSKGPRIARRAVAAFVVGVIALGAWRYTVDLRRERLIAVRAQEEAVRRRAQAEDLINFMVSDLRKKLEPVGRLDVLDDVAKKTLRYVSSVEPAQMDVDELVRNAKVLHQLGDVQIAQGKLDAAMETFRRSLALSASAARRAPADEAVRLSVGTSHFWLGNGYRLQGQLPEALRHLTEYMTAAEKLAGEHPGNDEYRLERAYGHSNVATILEAQGLYHAALEHHEVTRSIKAARLASDPANAEKQADVANTLNKIGVVMKRLGNPRHALTNFQRELEIYRGLAASDPSNISWKRRLIVSQSYVASTLEALGEYSAAFILREREIDANRELHARDPENADWQRSLAIAHMRRGNLLRIRRSFDAAIADYTVAESLIEPLTVRDPKRRSWQRDHAVIRVGYARAVLASGGAEESSRVAAKAAATLASMTPVDDGLPRFIAEAYLVLGDASAAIGDRASADVAWTSASTALQAGSRATQDLETLDVWTQVLHRLGRDKEAAPVVAQLARAGYIQPNPNRAALTPR